MRSNGTETLDTGNQALSLFELVQLMEALSESTSVRSVKLDYLELDYAGLMPGWLVSVADALGANAGVESLSLKGNNLRADSFRCVAEALASKMSLQSLALNNNRLDSVTCLAGVLALPALSSLFLDSNPLFEAGARALADALRPNRSLTVLSVQACQIGDEGAAAFGLMLPENTALKSLMLGVNRISDIGLRSLIQGLEQNHTLTALGLNSLPLGGEGLIHLAGFLERNISLKHVNLRGNRVNQTEVLSALARVWILSSLSYLGSF